MKNPKYYVTIYKEHNEPQTFEYETKCMDYYDVLKEIEIKYCNYDLNDYDDYVIILSNEFKQFLAFISG